MRLIACALNSLNKLDIAVFDMSEGIMYQMFERERPRQFSDPDFSRWFGDHVRCHVGITSCLGLLDGVSVGCGGVILVLHDLIMLH